MSSAIEIRYSVSEMSGAGVSTECHLNGSLANYGTCDFFWEDGVENLALFYLLLAPHVEFVDLFGFVL